MTRVRQRALVIGLVVAIAIGYGAYNVYSAAGRSTPAAGGSPRTVTTTGPATSTTLKPTGPKVPAKAVLAKDVSIFPSALDRSQWQRLLNLAQQAGVGVISTAVNWQQIEPRGPAPAGEFTGLDAFVEAARRRHLEVRFQLIGFPDWARDPGEPLSGVQPWLPPVAPSELARWSAFVGRVAHHFARRVRYYEVWNEENISSFWYPLPDPAHYADLLEASYLAVKAADPSAKVLYAGMSANDIGYLQQVYTAIDEQFPSTAIADHHFFDILGVHPYSGSRSPALVSATWSYPDDFGIMDENYLGFVQLHQVMAQHSEGYKDVYITEYGFTTTGFYGFPPISDAQRASYLRVAYRLASRVPYVIGFSWYCLYTNPYNGVGWAMLDGNYPWSDSATYHAFASVGHRGTAAASVRTVARRHVAKPHHAPKTAPRRKKP